METTIIKIPEELRNKVQKADIERSSRRDIITYILEKGIDISPERFDQYQHEYDEKYWAFEQGKQEIENNYVRQAIENPISWTLNYATCEVSIIH